MKALVVLLVSTLFGVSAQAGPTASTTESIYQLDVALANQSNQAIRLDVYRGQPTLITMFYASCPNVCPLLIQTMQSMEKSLGARDRNAVRVLMVSIDPERGTPAALTTLARSHHVDLSRWTLARASAADVRKLAAVLNIQ
jgi:protein SCO1